MANILLQSAIPSRLSNTDSTSSLLVDIPTENSHTNNKYNGHVTRLRNVFTEHSLMANKLNSDDHPLIVNGHTTTATDHETEEIFPSLDQNFTRHNAPLIPIRFMANHREEHSHENSSQSIHPSTHQSVDIVPNQNEDVSYAIINRRYSSAEQHYDFPADAIEQIKKKQRDEIESNNYSSNLPNEQVTTRFLPFNALKRMDHLNTVFVKPTKIEQSLPKLIFQDNNEQEQLRSPETSISHETDSALTDDRSSSPVFYEKPGIPELADKTISNGTRRVKFSNAPIRVYPTYSHSEYDRRNEDIDPFAAAAEYELEKRIEKMDVFTVEVEKGPDGLGISVLGMGVGADSGLEKLGIFVKSLNPQGIIARDGRIQVGDQIIEVNGKSLVGITHACATEILKTTSGLVKFIVGREKEPEKSEVFLLIQRSLQLDEQREDTSQTFQQYHDAYYEQNFNDDEDNEPMDERTSHEFEIEILKQCYESLERTLDNTEKEREHYRQLYQQAQIDLKQMEEKYIEATIVIKELQDRDIELRRQHIDLSEQHEKRTQELMKKVEELERVVTASPSKPENKLSSLMTAKFTASYPSNAIDRSTSRIRSSSGHPLVSTNRTPTTVSLVRIPSLSLEKILTRSPQDTESWQIRSSINTNRSVDQLDQSSATYKTHVGKTDTINVPFIRVSNPSLGESSNDSILDDTRSSVTKGRPVEKSCNDRVSSAEYIEIKDWTTDRCIQWLTVQNMASLIPIFINRNIDGEKLLVLDSSKMKAIGIKSSKDRDQLKTKIKELKTIELHRLREQFLAQTSSSTHRSSSSGKKSRSSSLTKLKERKFFSSSFGK